MKVWENRQAQQAARIGGLGLMAVSLAACGGSSTTTSTTSTTTTTTTPTVTPVSAALTIGNDAITGTTGNDAVTGARSDTVATLTSGDTIALGAGQDSLVATITGDLAPAAGGITGVESFTITALDVNGANGGYTITFATADQTNISGVTAITNVGSNEDLTIARVTESASITINNVATATTVTFADAVLAGSSDAVTLNVNGATGTINIGNVTAGAGTGIETLNIVATGAASTFSAVNLDASATTVNVTGSANLDINAADAFASVGTFDASAATGDIHVAFLADGVTGATNTKSITTGSGADDINISNIAAADVGAVTVNAGAGNDIVTLGGQGASDYTIVGGAGTDTLSISIVPAIATHSGISGFETLTVTNALTAAATVDLLQFAANSGFSRVNANITTSDNDSDGLETLTISNVAAGSFVLGMAALDVNDINVTVTRRVDGTTDAITVASLAASAVGTLSIADEETATFDSSDGAIDYTAVTGTDMTSLVLTGDNTIDLGTITAASLATVNATGMAATANGDFVANMSSSTVAMTVTSNASTTHTGILNITTGSGNDTITGTNNNDIIDGGAGADTLNGGAGNDLITGGTGADTLNGGAGTDTLTGGAGNDTMSGGAGADIFTFLVGFGADTITDFTAGTGGDVFDFDAYGNGATATTLDADGVAPTAAVNLVNNTVFVAAQTTANNTTALVDAIFDGITEVANNVNAVVTNHIYIAYSGAVGTIFSVVVTDGATNTGVSAATTELGTITLTGVDWTTLTSANFDLTV